MTTEPRWTDNRGISDLSVAVDDIYDLRALCAHVVAVIDDTLTLKSLSGYRQNELAEIRTALVAAAKGEAVPLVGNRKRALRDVGADECLTNDQWAAQRNLTRAHSEVAR